MAAIRTIRLRAFAITATVVLSAISAGCAYSESAPVSHALTKESQTSTTSPPALPVDAFPDMSSYNDAPYDVYGVVDAPRVQGFAFTTPDGLQCANNLIRQRNSNG